MKVLPRVRVAKRKFLVLGLMLIPLLIASIFYAQNILRTMGPRSCRANHKILSELYVKSQNGLVIRNDPLAGKVKNLSDSNTNADCLFVTTVYNVSINQPSEAEKSLNTLKQKKNLTISSDFLKIVYEDPIVYLQKRIEAARHIQSENQKNFIGIGDAEEQTQ